MIRAHTICFQGTGAGYSYIVFVYSTASCKNTSTAKYLLYHIRFYSNVRWTGKNRNTLNQNLGTRNVDLSFTTE